MSFAPRPLHAPSGELDSDGMQLAEALRAVWGEIPRDGTLQKLIGEASTRSYYRLASASRQGASLIVMRLPVGGTPRELGVAQLPFVEMQRYLAARSIRVPHIFHDASNAGVLLLEDLGDETFEKRLLRSPASWPSLYEAAVALLASLHERTKQRDDCIAFQRSFDEKLLRWELEHFREWGLDALGIQLSGAEQAVCSAQFSSLVRELLALPQGFTHRDYQSRNLMWTSDRELAVIDFQDALLGPLGYDMVALLCDSYVTLPDGLSEHLLALYAAQRGLPLEPLQHATRLITVQRKLKDAGRFVFIDQVRGNPAFLPYFGASLRHVGRALAQLPHYQPLFELLCHKLSGFPAEVATPPARTGARAGAA